MNRGEYTAVQARLVSFAAIVDGLPLTEFIDAGERAIGVGPILDPTLRQRGHTQLENVIKLARSLRTFQAEVERQVKGDG